MTELECSIGMRADAKTRSDWFVVWSGAVSSASGASLCSIAMRWMSVVLLGGLVACASEDEPLDPGTNRDAGTVVRDAGSTVRDAGTRDGGAAAPRDGGTMARDGGVARDGGSDRCSRRGFTSESQSAVRHYEDGTLFVDVSNNTKAPADILFVELYFDLGANASPHMFTLTGENYQDCGTCVLIGANCDDNGCDSVFLADTGQANFTSIGAPHGQFTGTITDLELIEVTIDGTTFVSTPVPNGERWCIDQLDIDTLVRANVEVAGEVVVELDANHPTAGGTTWTNAGSLGDFTEVGTPATGMGGAIPGIEFNGTTDAYEGPIAPTEIVGNSHRSVELWVFNPSIDAPEETLVSWSERGGPMGTHLTINYGNSQAFGSVAHWGLDMGWGTSGPPLAGVWHHLVYVFNGNTVVMYVDGDSVAAIIADTALQTKTGFPINIAAQRNMGALQFENEFVMGEQQAGSFILGGVRIHTEALSRDQIRFNFSAEALRYGL